MKRLLYFLLPACSILAIWLLGHFYFSSLTFNAGPGYLCVFGARGSIGLELGFPFLSYVEEGAYSMNEKIHDRPSSGETLCGRFALDFSKTPHGERLIEIVVPVWILLSGLVVAASLTISTFKKTMIPSHSLLVIICASLLLLPNGSAEDKVPRDFGARGDMVFNGFHMEESFASDELKTLAEKASRDYDEDRRLMALILRAGFERRSDFAYLLNREDLRKTTSIDLALSAYDFTMNQEESALDHILADLAVEDVGADADAIVVLSALDEWDRSVKAYRKHFVHTDGAGASAFYGFRATRAYLFPQTYEKHREVIEAPIVWQRSLIPKSRPKAEQDATEQPATAGESK